MTPELRRKIESFVEKEITAFHTAKAASLAKIDLIKLLSTKNPYLFRAKNLEVASDLIGSLLDARISSSEEGIFGHFLEELAIFISSETCSGKKAGIPGVDIELNRDGIRYLVAVKSGNNWGNQSQHKDLHRNLRAAVMVIKQSGQIGDIQPTLGICYGNFAKAYKEHYLHVGGKDFWELISGSQTLYRELIEPIGYKAKEHNQSFSDARAKLTNQLTKEFLEKFSVQGKIDWPKIVDLVSKSKEPRKAKAKKATAKKAKKRPAKRTRKQS
jgi:hypothetical protein